MKQKANRLKKNKTSSTSTRFLQTSFKVRQVSERNNRTLKPVHYHEVLSKF